MRTMATAIEMVIQIDLSSNSADEMMTGQAFTLADMIDVLLHLVADISNWRTFH